MLMSIHHDVVGLQNQANVTELMTKSCFNIVVAIAILVVCFFFSDIANIIF